MRKHGNHGEERAEHMARLKHSCDEMRLPYPPELVQYLNAQERDRRGR